MKKLESMSPTLKAELDEANRLWGRTDQRLLVDMGIHAAHEAQDTIDRVASRVPFNQRYVVLAIAVEIMHAGLAKARQEHEDRKAPVKAFRKALARLLYTIINAVTLHVGMAATMNWLWVAGWTAGETVTFGFLALTASIVGQIVGRRLKKWRRR